MYFQYYENKPTSHTVIFLIVLPNAITAKDVCLHLLVPHFAQYWLLWLFSNVLQHKQVRKAPVSLHVLQH